MVTPLHRSMATRRSNFDAARRRARPVEVVAVGAFLLAAAPAEALMMSVTDARADCSVKDIRVQYPEGTSWHARYTVTGTCTVDPTEKRFPGAEINEKTNRFTWTATGDYYSASKRTREVVIVPPPLANEAVQRRPYGRYSLDLQCDKDPWVYFPDYREWRCRSDGGFTASGPMAGDVTRSLQNMIYPLTSRVIPQAQRQALHDALRQIEQREAALRTVNNQPLRDARATPGATSSTAAGAQAAIAARPTQSSAARVGADLSAASGRSQTTSRAAGVAGAGVAQDGLSQQPGLPIPGSGPDPRDVLGGLSGGGSTPAAPGTPASRSTSVARLPDTSPATQSTQRTSVGNDGPASRSTTVQRPGGSATGMDAGGLPQQPGLIPGTPDPRDLLGGLSGGGSTPATPGTPASRSTTVAGLPNTASPTRDSSQRTVVTTDGPASRPTSVQQPGTGTGSSNTGGVPPLTIPGGGPDPRDLFGGLLGGGSAPATPATPASRSRTVAAPIGSLSASSTVTTTRVAEATPALQSRSTATAAATALQPHSTAPAANVDVRQGRVQVQAAMPGGTAVRDAEVEFTWIGPRANEPQPPVAPPPVRWVVPAAQLAQGTSVPPASGPSRSGRWQMRVRPASGSAAWSDAVAFEYGDANEPRGNAWGRRANEMERQGLNPQPLPPRETTTPASTFQR